MIWFLLINVEFYSKYSGCHWKPLKRKNGKASEAELKSTKSSISYKLRNRASLVALPNPSLNIHPWFQLVSMWKFNIRSPPKSSNWDQFGVDYLTSMDAPSISEWLSFVNVSLDEYQSTPIGLGWKEIQKICVHGTGTQHIPIFRYKSDYALLLLNRHHQVELEKNKECSVCFEWISGNILKHQQKCNRCDCGKRFTDLVKHSKKCKGVKTWKKCKNLATTYAKLEDGTPFNMDGCYFADLETFPDKITRKFTPYSIACIGPAPSDKPFFECGRHCIRDFFDYCNQLDGTLWFHNGGKFDAVFLLDYIFKNGLTIIPNSLMMTGSTITTFTLKTEKGELVLKDLYRFCKGSLLRLCKAYGVSPEESKSAFEHDSITNWEDVAKNVEIIKKYNIQDVIAMRAVYREYSKAIFEDHKILAKNYMTASHLAYGAWSAAMPAKHYLNRTPVELEEKTRSFYRGGRIVIGRPFWQSTDYAKVMDNMNYDGDAYIVDSEVRDSIEDYAVYGDVNSLYPAVMVNRQFPLGSVNYKVLEESLSQNMIEKFNPDDPETMEIFHRSAYCITIDPPKNLMIAFLMTKNEKGECQQSLELIKETWYTGPEILTAVRSGYKLIQFHEAMVWPQCIEIFTDFISKAYERKSKEKPDTPIYTSNKSIMNDLTGKFGQKTVCSEVHVTKTPCPEKGVSTLIWGDDWDLNVFLTTEYKTTNYTSYPVQLSCFILGWSKVRMWELLQKMNILYREEDNVYYGDTDSYIMHRKCWDALPDYEKSTEAKELNRVKLEVDGKIIRIIVLGPKMYMVIFICSKTSRLMSMVRCKGIPHTPIPYPAGVVKPTGTSTDKLQSIEDWFTENDQMRSLKSKKQPYSTVLPPAKPVVLGEVNYKFTFPDENKETVYTKQIPSDYFAKMLTGEVKCEVYYPTFKRTVDLIKSDSLFITAEYSRRNMIAVPWWQKGKRILLEGATLGDPSYPPGHEKII